jgi:hypothetical protein
MCLGKATSAIDWVPDPEPPVLVHPAGYFAKRFTTQRNEYLSSLLASFDESRSFQQFEMLGHGVKSEIERLGDIQESSRPHRQPPNDGSSRGMRYRFQYVGQFIHAYITPFGIMFCKRIFGLMPHQL